jgi:rare lipoprotein A (peptidoglycan hydrolase)
MDDFDARTRADFQRARRRADGTGVSPSRAATDDRRDLIRRPDRVAMWAFLMAIAITVAAAASAQGASSGGVSTEPEVSADEMVRQVATWYGPGFYGNKLACGGTLRRRTVGVAHRRLPCGTEVTFAYKGNYLTTEVIDRGPFANGAKWDLTQAAAERLGLEATDEIRVAVSGR